MTSPFVDHIAIVVPDLDAAVERYTRLGFTVTLGGQHLTATANALVPFQDGSYFELVGFRYPPEDPVEVDWYGLLERGGGLAAFCLGVPALDPILAQIRAAGGVYGDAVPEGRTRPDGVRVSWKIAVPEGERRWGLPFLIEDVTPREVRVPPGDAMRHANGVRGVRLVELVTADPDRLAERYRAIPGIEPVLGDAERGVGRRTLQLGSQWISLVSPEASPELVAYIAGYGDRPVAIELYGDQPIELDPISAGNARLRVVAEAGSGGA